jgi:NAD(P)-dependent dehydrogenase (short-subunit alcohol dehydrogenase family)
MKSVFITGANRGIGYGLVKQFLASKADHIFATYRQMDRSKELFDLVKQHTSIIVPIQLDIIDDTSIQKAVEKVEQSLNGKNLNCLINNAGMTAKLRFSNINEKDMMETYRQNVIGPWKVTKAFLPLLEKSASQLKQRDIKQSSVVNISSIMSSLELSKNLPYYYYDYQCSKVALNMLTICMGKDLEKKKIFFSLLHPGWVKTEMGTDKAPLTPDAAAKNIIECLQAITNEHYCKLIDTRDGKKLTVIPY